jgi:DNA (cytosine-5)-methyltransferase 1
LKKNSIFAAVEITDCGWKMNVVSFFAGCGGLDLGFEQAGFRVVWANEFEPHCRATYIRNHPNTEFVLGDICKIDTNIIPDCDGFIGGPPCQSWSVGGKQKGLDDERGQLFLKYIELINAKRPKFFVIENVKGLLDEKFKEVFDDFVERLDNAGYNVQWALLNTADYKIPQTRERVFFIGFRKEMNVQFAFPKPTSIEPTTLKTAIGDITEAPKFYSARKSDITLPIDDKCPNHDVLASKFGSFYYRGNRRRGWNQPSFTISATAEFAPLHPSSPKMLYFGHENWNFQKEKINEYRRLSVRECARIQTFPDNFIFEYDNIKDAYKMIGNAVPPRLGQLLAKQILDAFGNVNEEMTGDVQNSERINKACTLVGYYKSAEHLRIVKENRLYNVRSDGRKGSVFKEDCSISPKFLLLHHKEKAEIFELDAEEPILTDSTFLKSLGYKIGGETYLCFRLKNPKPISLKDLGSDASRPNYNQKIFSPYFTTLAQIIDFKI